MQTDFLGFWFENDLIHSKWQKIAKNSKNEKFKKVLRKS